MNSRLQAALILVAVIKNKHALDDAFIEYLTTSEQNTALIKALCYGTLRWYHQLDYLAKNLLSTPNKKIDKLVYILLLIGLYQLQFLHIPKHAAIFETVNAAHLTKKSWATGFLNGTLRNFLRLPQCDLRLSEPPSKTDHETRNKISAYYSHPLWLIAILQKAWPQQAANILHANNMHPPMHLRVNINKITRDDYLKLLTSQNIVAHSSPYNACGITLATPQDVNALPGFQQGLVSIQDIAAQFAAELLELKPKLRVLDACAAPGGKTAHILENEPHLTMVLALDIDNNRLQLIAQNLKRLHLSTANITLLRADVQQPTTWWDGKQFDRILLDAPCSATGVIRRHPDIKLLRNASDITKLAKKQYAMLHTLWPLLADGGILVYATCSVIPEENSKNIARFLQTHVNAQEKLIQHNWGIAAQHGRQLFPENLGTDGFYYAVIQKIYAQTK